MKKLVATSVMLMSTLALTACASQSTNGKQQTLIEYSNKKVTVNDVYQLAIDQNLVQEALHDVVIADVFSQLYGKDVTKKDVDEQFKRKKDTYQNEDDFKNALKAAGLTEESYKTQLKSTIAYQRGLIDLLKIEDGELKEKYKSYTPDSTIKLAIFDNEQTAQEFVNSIKNGSDFASKASELKSLAITDKSAQVTFDSHDNELPHELLDRVYELKENQISGVLSHVNEQLNVKMYFVVQMIKTPNKSKDWSVYKDRLTEIYRDEKLNDQGIVDALEKKALEKSNFKIRDDAFKQVFQAELNAK